MAKQIDTVSVYLHIRSGDTGSYKRVLQRISAVLVDPTPLKSIDKEPVVVEDQSFGVTFDESSTVKKLLDDVMAAVSDKTGVAAFTDAVIHRTTFQYLTNVDKSLYPSKDWLIGPDLNGVAGVQQKYWKVVADTVVEMNGGEKAVVDAGTLQATIDSSVATWTYSINKFVANHYNLGQQQTLQTCWLEALSKGWVNRGAKVQQVWDWIQTALDYFYKQRQAMWDAKNLDELNAVAQDLTTFEKTDPKVVVEEVDKLTN